MEKSIFLKNVRSILRKLFYSSCPSVILKPALRNLIHIEYSHDPDLVVKIAETKEELEGAFQVLYRSYLEKGYCEKIEAEMKLTLHHALPTTSVIIAKYKGQVVGTLTLVRNNNLKLPCEKEWDLGFLKKDDRRVAEITCLAVDKNYRRVRKGNIFFPILKYMYSFATRYFGTEILTVVVHPDEKDFYQGVLQFQPIEKRVVVDYFGGPAIALYLDLVQAKEMFRRVYGGKPAHKDLYRYFEEFTSKNLVMPEKNSFSVDYPVLNKDLFYYFFFEKSKIGYSVDDLTLQKILQHYPSRSVIRASSRFTVDIRARLTEPWTKEKREVIIKNISETGIRLISLDHPLDFFKEGKNYEIQFENNEVTFKMTITGQWASGGTQAGFKVISNQLNWHRFLKSIHYKYVPMEDVQAVFINSKSKAG
jgi:hypothetical protein